MLGVELLAGSQFEELYRHLRSKELWRRSEKRLTTKGFNRLIPVNDLFELSLFFLHMLMLEDVVLAVSQATAFGAIAELHLGMGQVGDTADGAYVKGFAFLPGDLPGLRGHPPVAGLACSDRYPCRRRAGNC